MKRTAGNKLVVAVRVNPQIEQRLRLLTELTGRRQSFFLQQMPGIFVGGMLGKRIVRTQTYSALYFANDLNGDDVPGIQGDDVHCDEINVVAGVRLLSAAIKRANEIAFVGLDAG